MHIMFLARLVGTRMQVYPLKGEHQAIAWRFHSYGHGAAAKAATQLEAIVKARQQLKLDSGLRSGMNQDVWVSS